MVPQKAKAPLTEPVVLLIPSVNVRVSIVAVEQELQKSPPVNFAITNSRSLEVQEVPAGGKVCAKDIDIQSIFSNKKAHKFFESVKFDFIQLGLAE